MQLRKYLENLLGKSEAENLVDAIREGKTIVVRGPQGPTGKTTLCNALRKAGASAVESWNVYEVTVQGPLETQKPLMEELISF